MRKVVQHGIGLPQVGIFVSGLLDDNWRMDSLVDTVFSYHVYSTARGMTGSLVCSQLNYSLLF